MAGRKDRSSSSGLCCIQTFLVFFNIITLLGGVATLGIGSWLLHQSLSGDDPTITLLQEDDVHQAEDFHSISIILVALGSLVTFISFLGCFGAFANSRCLLLCYLVSVTLILILQLIVSTVAVLYREPMNESIEKELLQHIEEKYKPSGPYALAWDAVQINFRCCGVNGYKDWFRRRENASVPDSCCRIPQNNTGCGAKDPSFLNEKGCIGQIQSRMMEQLPVVASAILAIVFFQLYGIIASTLLFYHTKSMQTYNAQRTSTPYKSYSYERAGII